MKLIDGLVALAIIAALSPLLLAGMALRAYRATELIALHGGDADARDRAEYKQTL